MSFIYQDLGQRQKGDVVQVTLSTAANVRLLDSSNYNSYKNGRRHSYHGGLAKISPLNLSIPRSGRWYAVVDMQGLRGSVKAGFRVLPRPLPEIRERRLAEVPSLIRDIAPTQDENSDINYDVFISHA